MFNSNTNNKWRTIFFLSNLQDLPFYFVCHSLDPFLVIDRVIDDEVALIEKGIKVIERLTDKIKGKVETERWHNLGEHNVKVIQCRELESKATLLEGEHDLLSLRCSKMECLISETLNEHD